MPTASRAFPVSQLSQDVYEIDLLLDFISGRPDKHIATLDQTVTYYDGAHKVSMSEKEVIERFYTIKVPILHGGPVLPEHEWFILKLKDVLNTFVNPARGMTIAYTLMFSTRRHFYPECELNRLAIAQKAFPGLVENAETFRTIKSVFAVLCIAVTLTGAFLLAQAFYGEQLADRFEAAKTKETEASERLYLALEEKNQLPQSELKTFCDEAVNSRSTAQIREMCDDFAYKHALLCATVHDVGAYGKASFYSSINSILPSHEFGQSKCAADQVGNANDFKRHLLSESNNQYSAPEKSENKIAPGQQEDAPSLLTVLTLLTNYMLPLLFGLSGSLTAFLRGLQAKVRDSVLAPRDSALTFISLPLGIIAGVTVGLLFNSNSSSGGVKITVESFTMSSAGVAFLAGYGAETFFLMLDSMSNSVFRIKDPPPPANSQPSR